MVTRESTVFFRTCLQWHAVLKRDKKKKQPVCSMGIILIACDGFSTSTSGCGDKWRAFQADTNTFPDFLGKGSKPVDPHGPMFLKAPLRYLPFRDSFKHCRTDCNSHKLMAAKCNIKYSNVSQLFSCNFN